MAATTRYGDRYEQVSLIARGGMAEVWLAHDRLLDRTVALKVLFPELSVDPNFVERFRREAQSAANLSHPNIVSVYDWGEASGTYYIVMEYIDGQPLSAMLRKGPLPPETAAVIGADVAAALGFAHRHGVIHRDVKPGNVLLTNDGRVKVTDFGIARAANTDDHLTQTGAVMGTATYFSPEQAQGLAVDQRSDVYALGVVLYEMVTGAPPFVAESPVATAYKHVHEQAQRPTAVRPDLSPNFEAIVLQAMAKNAIDRYANAEELRADLLRFRQGRAVLAVTPPPPPSAPRATRVHAKSAPKPAAAPVPAPATTVVKPPPVAIDTPPEAEEESSSLRVYAIVLGVLLLALIVVLLLLSRQLGLFAASGTGDANKAAAAITMPADLIGKQYDDALTELQKLGVQHVTRDDVTDATHKAGVVTATTPAAGQPVPADGTVTLTDAVGAAQVQEPDVIGESATMATQQLQQAGFVVANPVAQDSTSVQPGTVMAQNPPALSQVGQGSTVTLTVSDGKGQALVPNEVGKDLTTAMSDLQAAGLTGYTAGHQHSATVPVGAVMGMSPAVGSALTKGSQVGLTLSEGPGQVRVPYVRGEKASTAATQLETAGLVVAQTAEATQYPSDDGVVLSSSPSGGTVVEQGTTVNLVVGQYEDSTTTTTATPGF